MPKIPANRIAAIVAVIAGVLGALVPVLADLDTTSVVGLIGGLAVILGTIDRFLKGSQEWDRLQAQTAATVGPATGSVADIGLVDDPEADDVSIEELPSDEEELASPPPDDPEGQIL